MRPQLDRRGLGFWVGVIAGLVLLASLGAIALSAVAVSRLDDAKSRLVEKVGPVRTANFQLTSALLDEETAVRGYLLGRRTEFLQPYSDGMREEAAQSAIIDKGTRTVLRGQRDDWLALARAIRAWRTGYAVPTIRAVAGGQPSRVADADVARGKRLFDRLRVDLQRLTKSLATRRDTARADLDHSTRDLKTLLLVSAILILLAALAAAVVLRRVVIAPLGRLRSEVNAVASGDFERELSVRGPREIAEASMDVDLMRRRILEELEAIRAAEERVRQQATELERSNSELEQFAYVASHDLQEPLRKIVSFNQMLERRYKGQLDERADQYIGFAVDGARRMQVLINDLLAFSRVGRMTEGFSVFSADDAVADAITGLRAAIEESGAVVDVAGPLPDVRGERSLIALVLGNLIANAIKFRGDEPPRVSISVRRVGDENEITVSDNGIGIGAEYAERIFVIFQRLHPRSEYEGTGIGLAMARKIIEYHGGRIWLDESPDAHGATFRLTLPVA